MFRSFACSVALAAAALFFTVATVEAAPQYVYGNYGSVATSIFSATVGYVNSTQNNTLVSQGFTTGTGQWDIQQVDVALAASGTGATDSRVYLFDDNAGVPGSLLSTYSLTNGPVDNSKTTHFFTGSYVASPSTNYWLVLGDVNLSDVPSGDILAVLTEDFAVDLGAALPPQARWTMFEQASGRYLRPDRILASPTLAPRCCALAVRREGMSRIAEADSGSRFERVDQLRPHASDHALLSVEFV
jgi:hypothetical protein